MSTETEKEPHRESGCLCLTKCSHSIQHSLERIFSKLGRSVGNNPWITIILSVTITISFGAGFMNWTEESRTNKLWIPQNTKAEEHSNWVSDVFGFETRTEQILLRPKDHDNVLKAKYVEQYYIAHYLMVNHTSQPTKSFENEFPGSYSWDGYKGSNSICLRLGSSCDMESILDIVGYDLDSIQALTDEMLLSMINNPAITARLDIASIIGGLRYDDDGNIISGAVLAGTYKVTAAAIDYNNNFIDPSRESWEADVNDKILSYDFLSSDCIVIPYFEHAWALEFVGAISADGMAYGIGCLLLIIYTTIALGKRDYVHSMIGLALCAILTVALAILGSYGLASALSIIYTPLSSSLPFLALGLGVDDAFIIAGEFQQQIKDHLILKGHGEISAAELMEHTMKHAGVSILITSLTDVVAFGIGSTTVLPALKAYCLYAAFGVLFVFVLNITFFAACVVLDHDRAIANKMDFCCCITMSEPHEMFPELTVRRQSFIDKTKINQNVVRHSYCYCLHIIPTEASRKMWRWIGEQVTNVFIRSLVLILALMVLSFGIYGAHKLKQDFKIEWFIPDTSYLQEYYSWKSAYFDTGTPIFIYSTDIDYFAHKEQLLECNYLLRNASYLEHSAYDWHLPFWQYVDSGDISVSGDNYYLILQSFLYSSTGGQYAGLIEWKDASQPQLGIEGAFMIGHYQRSAVSNAEKQVSAMFRVRDDMRDIVGDDDIFPFTFQMLFWEQYAVIAVEFFRNLILAVIVVFAIALILIPRISAALLVLFTVICTIVDVMGFMWLWGLTIDAVTVCYTVIAIGLAVDYSAHVGEAFVLSTKATKNQRVIDSLHRIGSSVFNGAFSTFLAVAAMANSQTYIFRVFFRQFFLVSTIGSVHGLVVLPAMLSLFGPNNINNKKQAAAEENKNTPILSDVEQEKEATNKVNKEDHIEMNTMNAAEEDSDTEIP